MHHPDVAALHRHSCAYRAHLLPLGGEGSGTRDKQERDNNSKGNVLHAAASYDSMSSR